MQTPPSPVLWSEGGFVLPGSLRPAVITGSRDADSILSMTTVHSDMGGV